MSQWHLLPISSFELLLFEADRSKEHHCLSQQHRGQDNVKRVKARNYSNSTRHHGHSMTHHPCRSASGDICFWITATALEQLRSFLAECKVLHNPSHVKVCKSAFADSKMLPTHLDSSFTDFTWNELSEVIAAMLNNYFPAFQEAHQSTANMLLSALYWHPNIDHLRKFCETDYIYLTFFHFLETVVWPTFWYLFSSLHSYFVALRLEPEAHAAGFCTEPSQ